MNNKNSNIKNTNNGDVGQNKGFKHINPQYRQNVQRLGNEVYSSTLPKVLGDLIIHDETILKKREDLIKRKKTRGNNREINEYKKQLPPDLSSVQFSWSLGLALSDASLQANSSSNERTIRMKMQQAEKNLPMIVATQEILKPWIMEIPDPSERGMVEIVTVQHKAFLPLANLLQDPAVELKPNACVEKRIPNNIGGYLNEVAIAGWFCGDGGRRDYNKNEGKAIQFHSQGFTKECYERLASALRERYGWNTICKHDYTNEKGRDFYLIQIEANSFESFMEIVAPYILPHFIPRLPKPRSENSRFKSN